MFWLAFSIETTPRPLLPFMPLANWMPSKRMLLPPQTCSVPIVASCWCSARIVTVLA